MPHRSETRKFDSQRSPKQPIRYLEWETTRAMPDRALHESPKERRWPIGDRTQQRSTSGHESQGAIQRLLLEPPAHCSPQSDQQTRASKRFETGTAARAPALLRPETLDPACPQTRGSENLAP